MGVPVWQITTVEYLIHSYFQQAHVRVYDSDAAPDDWGGLEVIGRKGDYAAIARCMAEDVEELNGAPACTVRDASAAGKWCG
jgi:hypothetical protein